MHPPTVALVGGCALLTGCALLPSPVGAHGDGRSAAPTTASAPATTAPADPDPAAVQRRIRLAVAAWPAASPQVLAPPPAVAADPTEQDDLEWLRGWARDTLVYGNVNTATLRGDLGPWADADDGRLSIDYVREHPGLDSLVMATRFAGGWAVVAPPRVSGEWSTPVTGPTDLQMSWSGTFAYPLERGGEARTFLVQRRATFDYDTVTHEMGWLGRAHLPGIDSCAGHVTSAVVPAAPPTAVPRAVQEPTRLQPAAVPDVADRLREAGCADARATPWP